MSPFRRPAVRLLLAAATAGLLVPGVPALADKPVATPAGVAVAQSGSQTQLGVVAAAGAASNVVTNVIACDGGRCEGTDDRDTIVASNKPERVFGEGGDDDIELDVVFASGSSDEAYGGPGRDCIDGGGGGDLMIGGPGDDNRACEFTAFVDPLAALTGGPGDDRIEGGSGDDTMNGIFDDDTLLGGSGNDLLRDPSPLDKDRLFGGSGRDTLDARDGDGDDLIDGGTGSDDCTGDQNDQFVNCERIQRL